MSSLCCFLERWGLYFPASLPHSFSNSFCSLSFAKKAAPRFQYLSLATLPGFYFFFCPRWPLPCWPSCNFPFVKAARSGLLPPRKKVERVRVKLFTQTRTDHPRVHARPQWKCLFAITFLFLTVFFMDLMTVDNPLVPAQVCWTPIHCKALHRQPFFACTPLPRKTRMLESNLAHAS